MKHIAFQYELPLEPVERHRWNEHESLQVAGLLRLVFNRWQVELGGDIGGVDGPTTFNMALNNLLEAMARLLEMRRRMVPGTDMILVNKNALVYALMIVRGHIPRDNLGPEETAALDNLSKSVYGKNLEFTTPH